MASTLEERERVIRELGPAVGGVAVVCLDRPGLSKRVLAERLGVSEATVARARRGLRGMSPQTPPVPKPGMSPQTQEGMSPQTPPMSPQTPPSRARDPFLPSDTTYPQEVTRPQLRLVPEEESLPSAPPPAPKKNLESEVEKLQAKIGEDLPWEAARLVAWAKNGEPVRCPPGKWRAQLRRLEKYPRWAVSAALETFVSAGVPDPAYLVGIARGRVREGPNGGPRGPGGGGFRRRARGLTEPGDGSGFEEWSES